MVNVTVMKKGLLGAHWVAAGVLLAGLNVAQAVPLCDPTYGPRSNDEVTLHANCVPDAGQTILSNGYTWIDAAAASSSSGGSTKVVPVPGGVAAKTYSVLATQTGGATSVAASVDVDPEGDPICLLHITTPPAANGVNNAQTPASNLAVGVNAGEPLQLRPKCFGSATVEWYSNSQLMTPPPSGGMVYPTVSPTVYTVVGDNGLGVRSTSNAVTVTVNPQASQPSCSITGPGSAAANTSITLTMACTNNAGATYTWSRDGSNLANCSSAACQNNLDNANGATSHSYTAVVSVGGWSASSTLQVSILTDDTAPSVPTGLAGTTPSTTQVDLSWTASTDNVGGSGMAAYKVYRDSVQVGNPAGASFSDTGLTASTTYVYKVAACDNAGNCSAYSSSLSKTTPATADTDAPTVPGGLDAIAVSGSQINLTWTAATDNVGVTSYKVYRGGALHATLGNVTSYSNTGLTELTQYDYTVAACDSAGNCSAQSASVSATTPAASPTSCGPGAVVAELTSWSGSSSPGPLATVPADGLALRFVAPANMNGTVQVIGNLQPTVPKLITISDQPCVFTQPNVGTGALKYCSRYLSTNAPFVQYTTTGKSYRCSLTAGTVYYVNIRNAKNHTDAPTSCGGTPCKVTISRP